jgi:hypothetical protein
MSFIAIKKIKGKKYYYLVESKREGIKIKQKVIEYLGSEKKLLEKLGIKTNS